ncbi:hypothetical protein ACYTPF_16650 [Alteromonas sp. HB246098]
MKHSMDRLREPFNETTRKSQRNLLISSILGIIASRVGLIPTKITAFGVDFSLSNIESLIALLSAIILYFLFAFIVYSASEYQALHVLSAAQNIERLDSIANNKVEYNDELLELKNELNEKFRKSYQATIPVYASRLILELIAPVIVALFSLFSLYSFDVKALFL